MAGSYTRIVYRGDYVEAAARQAMARGLNRAAERLLAIVTPFTPQIEGDLVGAYGIHDATPESVEEGAQLQNSSKYAAFQHEGMRADGSHVITKHTHDPHPAARTKFMEVPFAESRTELAGIVAAEIAGTFR